MGNIIDMADKFNTANKQKTNKKETFKIRREHLLKDFANLTLNPNFYGKYKLDKRYRNIQLGARGVGIAVLVVSLGLGLGGLTLSNYTSENTSETEMTYETLDRDTVFTEAKVALSNIILPGGSKYSHTPAHVDFPTRDEFRNINSVEVSELIGTNYSSIYTYNISNNKDKKSNPDIYNEFIEKLIEVANSSSPSQTTLKELQDLTEQILSLKLQLQGEHIVALNVKEADTERY